MPDTINFPALNEVKGKLEDRRAKLASVFQEAGPEMDFTKVKCIKGSTYEIAAEVRKLNDEMTDLGKNYQNLQATLKAAERAKMSTDKDGPEGGFGEGGNGNSHDGLVPAQKSIGRMFIESNAYKQREGQNGPEVNLDINLKGAIFLESAGWTPQAIRTGRVVDAAVRPIQVTDLLPQTTTGMTGVVYMEETTYGSGLTTGAVEVTEGQPYADTAFALTERTSSVRKIGVSLAVTDEQLEDIQQVEGYVNNRLPFMIRQRLDQQILVGDGSAPNLRGLLNVVGIQTQAKGSDPTPDAIYKALVAVRITGRAQPDSVVFHPTNWQSVRLLRTADGIYIWGNPSDAGVSTIWGLQVTQADSITLGTAVVGDFANFSELSMRRGLNVQVTNSHNLDFLAGQQRIRADLRAAVVYYRPAAFCTVTGL
jgi:hypothetical protein